MSDVAFREGTKSLLRPNQIDALDSEKQRLEEMLSPAQPSHVKNSIQGRNEAANQLRRLTKQLDDQIPTPYVGSEKDLAIAREKQLREEWLVGMNTQAEQRRAPAGAVDKHLAWDERNKDKVLEWKRIRLRLHAGGDIPGLVRNARDAANIELFRPRGGSGEMNMDNTQIAGKSFHFPQEFEQAVVFNDEEMDYLKTLAPEVALRLAVLPTEVRAQALEIVRSAMSTKSKKAQPVAVSVSENTAPQKKVRKPLSEERRQALRDQLAMARAKKKKKKTY